MTAAVNESARAETDSGTESVELSIGGMTCASCTARIEKKLNRLDGVIASVNYATEKSKVVFPASVTPSDLVSVIEGTGHTASCRRREAEHRVGAAPRGNG
jgi:Cu+-exporting ATPase